MHILQCYIPGCNKPHIRCKTVQVGVSFSVREGSTQINLKHKIDGDGAKKEAGEMGGKQK